MESSGQVTKTEEIMINGEDNDASKTCQDAVKRTGKRTAVSQYCGELSRERSSERDPYDLDAILCKKYDSSGQIRHSGKIEKFNGYVTVAKIKQEE